MHSIATAFAAKLLSFSVLFVYQTTSGTALAAIRRIHWEISHPSQTPLVQGKNAQSVVTPIVEISSEVLISFAPLPNSHQIFQGKGKTTLFLCKLDEAFTDDVVCILTKAMLSSLQPFLQLTQ